MSVFPRVPAARRTRITPRLERLEGREVPATLDIGFPTIDLDDSIAVGGGDSAPPDTHGAAGPNHVLTVVNSSISWHTKDGTRQFHDDLGVFFAPGGAQSTTFDPKAIYDAVSGRFVVITLDSDQSTYSSILVAVSNTTDPNDGWRYQRIDALLNIGGNTYWTDYPGLAIDDNAIYVTGNIFATGNGGGQNARLWIIDKGLYTGAQSNVTVHDPYAGTGLQSFTMQPAALQGTRPAGFNGTFLVSYGRNTGIGGGATNDEARVVRVTNPLSNPTFTLTQINLGNVDDATNPNTQPVNQPGAGSTLLDGGDTRVYNAVWRDNMLVFANSATPGSGLNAGQATVNLMIVDVSGAAPTLLRQQYIGGEDLPGNPHTFYPSVAVNNSREIGVGFAASGSFLLPGAYFTVVDLDTGAVDATETVVAGTAVYESFATFTAGTVRYGDYTATVLDPDDFSFWTFNQFSDPPTGNGSNWATFAGQLSTSNVVYATGAGAGGGPLVKVFRGRSNRPFAQFYAYDQSFNGGVRVSVADMNGDGIPDIITVAGAGGGPHVKVFDGRDFQELASFYAFEQAFTGGLFVTTGDLDGDELKDIIVSADAGGGPRVSAFRYDITTGAISMVANFFAFDPGFIGGVRIAAGDFNGDGKQDIVVAPGLGGGPNVRVYDGNRITQGAKLLLRDLFVASPTNYNGLFVAAGDFTGDKLADIAVSAGSGLPWVRVYNGQTLALIQQFLPPVPGPVVGLLLDQGANLNYTAITRTLPLNLLPPGQAPDQLPVQDAHLTPLQMNGYSFGARIAAADLNNDFIVDLILGGGPTDSPSVSLVNGKSFAEFRNFFAYEDFFYGGVFVGATGDLPVEES